MWGRAAIAVLVGIFMFGIIGGHEAAPGRLIFPAEDCSALPAPNIHIIKAAHQIDSPKQPNIRFVGGHLHQLNGPRNGPPAFTDFSASKNDAPEIIASVAESVKRGPAVIVVLDQYPAVAYGARALPAINQKEPNDLFFANPLKSWFSDDNLRPMRGVKFVPSQSDALSRKPRLPVRDDYKRKSESADSNSRDGSYGPVVSLQKIDNRPKRRHERNPLIPLGFLGAVIAILFVAWWISRP